MALDLKIDLSNKADAMILIDNTGNYSISNTGGWGTPNYAKAGSTLAVVVTPPGGTALTSIATTSFPASVSEYDITTDLDNLDQGLVDGVWKFAYTLTTTGPVTSTYTLYRLRTFDIEQTLGQLALLDLRVVDFQKFKFLYDKALIAFDQGEYVLAEDLLNELNDGLSDSSYGVDFNNGCNC